MYKFVVVTDPDSAPGFRLAGVDVLEASSLDEAKKIIPPLIYKDDTGIVAISEDLMAALDEKTAGKDRQDLQADHHSDPFQDQGYREEQVTSNGCCRGQSGIIS